VSRIVWKLNVLTANNISAKSTSMIMLKTIALRNLLTARDAMHHSKEKM
jgi:hypothetical protein